METGVTLGLAVRWQIDLRQEGGGLDTLPDVGGKGGIPSVWALRVFMDVVDNWGQPASDQVAHHPGADEAAAARHQDCLAHDDLVGLQLVMASLDDQFAAETVQAHRLSLAALLEIIIAPDRFFDSSCSSVQVGSLRGSAFVEV